MSDLAQAAAVDALTMALFNQFVQWHNIGYAAPVPEMVKQAVRGRYATPNAVWLELGMGDGTTSKLLALQSRLLVGVEPDRARYEQAVQQFPEGAAVRLFNATPKQALPHLLPQIVGDLNVWLAGHHPARSAGTSRAEPSTLLELAEIGRFRPNFRRLCVMVDAIRCFDPANAEFPEYPSLELLVDWARAQDLMWHIEHDMFIARSA